MQKKDKEELRKILGGLVCPADFQCYTHALKNLRKVEYARLETYLELLEKHAYECPFQIPVTGVNHLRCPLREYIAKKIKK
jgi:hypothetical protein